MCWRSKKLCPRSFAKKCFMFDSVRKKGELEVESKNDKSFYETHQISYEDECGENKLMKVIFNKIEK